ncbi:MAG: GNAT family N-acetyltransferase [Acidimicrobiia bacterium]
MNTTSFLYAAAMAHTIRPASPGDEPFLIEMLYEALYVPSGMQPFPRDVLDQPDLAPYHRDFGLRTGDRGVIAEDASGTAIGAAWVRLFDNSAPGYGFIDDSTPELSIAVIPDHRNQGVGSDLLVRLLDGLERCSLSVDERNPAVRLYERFGFRGISRDGRSVKMLLSGEFR